MNLVSASVDLATLEHSAQLVSLFTMISYNCKGNIPNLAIQWMGFKCTTLLHTQWSQCIIITEVDSIPSVNLLLPSTVKREISLVEIKA